MCNAVRLGSKSICTIKSSSFFQQQLLLIATRQLKFSHIETNCKDNISALFYRISDIKPEDEGVYMCIASNQYGQSEPLIHTIEVAKDPQTAVKAPAIAAADSVKEGDEVRRALRCSM